MITPLEECNPSSGNLCSVLVQQDQYVSYIEFQASKTIRSFKKFTLEPNCLSRRSLYKAHRPIGWEKGSPNKCCIRCISKLKSEGEKTESTNESKFQAIHALVSPIPKQIAAYVNLWKQSISPFSHNHNSPATVSVRCTIVSP